MGLLGELETFFSGACDVCVLGVAHLVSWSHKIMPFRHFLKTIAFKWVKNSQ